MQSLRLRHRQGDHDNGVTSAYLGHQVSTGSLDRPGTPTVIVMGSTTTALLIEALAHAEMLPCDLFGDSGKGHTPRPVVVRTDRWSSVTEIANRLSSCFVVTTAEPKDEGADLRDAAGRSVPVLHADALLESACRSIPSRSAGDANGNRILARMRRWRRHLPSRAILDGRPALRAQYAGGRPAR